MKLDLDMYVERVLGGRRAVVARAVTLVESTQPGHRESARRLVTRLMPHGRLAARRSDLQVDWTSTSWTPFTGIAMLFVRT
ncbi:hypothetical protein [Streptomyces sp. NBC_01336]|uniref:hypothetical protein n=1 Tax=Streptomyces sp. NBC_01336 TaxID=2903829 RepID=UPI003FCC7AB5